MRLDARYTLKTEQGDLIYVRSKGIFNPKEPYRSSAEGAGADISQDQAEWFTRLQFEVGKGSYEWLNSIFAIGVLTMHKGKILIDAYSLTNLPRPRSTENLVAPLC